MCHFFRTVEQKNLEAGGRFEAEVTEGLSGVCGSIEEFRLEHSNFCGNQRLILGKF